MVCRTDKKPSGTREHVRSTPWAMRVSILWGHGSNSCVRFMGYSLRPFGSAFGSEKSSGRKQQLMQTKRPETVRFRVFLARHEGFEPPAFWSVGCLTHKSESFRLRFVLFAAIRSADLPLFPSSPARFFRVLGQKWVKDRCMAGEFEQSVRIHTERLIGQQLFLPKGLRLDHFVRRHRLWQELQN